MGRIYAMSDIHGCLDVFEQALGAVDFDDPDNLLVLLGDYVPHCMAHQPKEDFERRCADSLQYVKELCEQHAGRVVALKGNHEFDLAENVRGGLYRLDHDLLRWIEALPFTYETEWQIFVHAGIDEEAEDLWRVGTDDVMFCCKFPATFGPFYKDIVAGHVGTHSMHGQWGEHDVYWDGQSHYYIDGTTEESGILPVLIYDTATGKYTSRLATAEGLDYESPIFAGQPDYLL